MGVFHFYCILHRNFCKQSVDPDQMQHFVASELCLHNMHMAQKRANELRMFRDRTDFCAGGRGGHKKRANDLKMYKDRTSLPGGREGGSGPQHKAMLPVQVKV